METGRSLLPRPCAAQSPERWVLNGLPGAKLHSVRHVQNSCLPVPAPNFTPTPIAPVNLRASVLFILSETVISLHL